MNCNPPEAVEPDFTPSKSSPTSVLTRRKGETLAQLLTRLDQAIAKAHTEGVVTDEIDPPLQGGKLYGRSVHITFFVST